MTTHSTARTWLRIALLTLGAAAVLAVTLLLGTAIGETRIPLEMVRQVLANQLFGAGYAVDPIDQGIVWNYRLTRAIVAMCCGTGLALSGVILQSLLRNALADPYLLGISAGASTGAVLVTVAGLGAGAISMTAGAFGGAVLAFTLVRRDQRTTADFADAPSLASVRRAHYSVRMAVVIGLLGIAAWWLSWQAGRNYGYGVATPTANLLQYLTTGQSRYLNWGSLFVLGILPGAWISALMTGEFRWRVPAPEQVPQRIAGGVLMGIGATLAGGCTITNTLVATAYFSWQGWIATLMIIAGAWIGLRITGQGRMNS